MNTTAENRYIRTLGNAIQREAYFYPPMPPRGKQMDLRCPNCHGSNLKKVSLAYREGLSRGTAKTRLRALLFGEDGPNVIVGRAVTNGTYQTELSKALRPPKKWSYGKLLLWASFVLVISLIFYVHSVMSSSSTASALPAVMFGMMGLGAFGVFAVLIWRQNHLVYPRAYNQWERSLVCERCGDVSQHDL